MNRSKYLSYVKSGNDYFVYHKLFGNLTLIGEKEYNFLNNFEDGRIEEGSLVEYLIDNFFINESDEEAIIVENEKKNRRAATDGRMLTGIQLVVSNFCNFECKYCFLNEEHKLRDNSEFNAPSNMEFNVAKKAMDYMIDNVKKNGNSVLSVEFFGGEPLMNWSLVKKVLDEYGVGEKYGIEIAYTITTNGSLINDEMIDYFEKYNVLVIVSYDSPNSRERLVKNNKELNDILFPVFEKMKDRDIDKSFNSVISRYTIEQLNYNDLIELAVKYNIQNIGLILDLDVELLNSNVQLDDIVDLIIEAYYLGKDKGINVTGYWEKMYLQINNQDAVYFEKGYKACPAIGAKISVEPSGDIFACKCCPTKIGNIFESGDFLTSNGYVDYLNKVYKNSDECGACDFRSFCSGVCVGTLEKSGSKYGRNELLCYVYKKITRILIERTKEDEVFLMLKDMEV